MLDDLLTLSKLPPVPERVLHLQVELGQEGGVKGGANIHQVLSINSTMYTTSYSAHKAIIENTLGKGGYTKLHNRYSRLSA